MGDYMTQGVECVRAGDAVYDVAESMLDHKHRRRPVLNDQGEMVGQVTCRRLLGAIKDFDIPNR